MHHHILLSGNSALVTMRESYRQYFEDRSGDEESDTSTTDAVEKTRDTSLVEFDSIEFPPIISFHVNTETEVSSPKSKSSFAAVFFITFSVTLVVASVTAILYLSPAGTDGLNSSLITPIKKSKGIGIDASDFSNLFRDISEPFDSSDIPVLLDLPGSGSYDLTSELSKCFGVDDMFSPDRIYVDDKANKLPSVIRTDSLCGISQIIGNKKARIFLLVHNPLVRIVNSFLQKQDITHTRFDERYVGMNFTDFAKSSLLDTNILTRSILCKNNGDITDEDFHRVKDLVERKFMTGVLKNGAAISKQLQQILGRKTSSENSSCVKSVFTKTVNTPIFQYISDIEDLNDVWNKNSFDFKLYNLAIAKN